MQRHDIDFERLRLDVATLCTESMALKGELRATWTRPMADEQKRLCRLKRRLTELYVLIAATRGRLHVTSPPRAVRDAGIVWDQAAWHARIAKRVALDYAPPPREANAS